MAIETPSTNRLAWWSAVFCAALTVPLTTAVTTWWLIGDLSFRPDDPASLDYMWRQPPVPPLLENGVGVVALAALIAALVVLVRENRCHRLSAAWCIAVSLLGVAGVLSGGIERSVTGGVVGANIGGGIALFVGVPVTAGLVLIAIVVVSLDALRRSRDRRRAW